MYEPYDVMLIYRTVLTLYFTVTNEGLTMLAGTFLMIHLQDSRYRDSPTDSAAIWICCDTFKDMCHFSQQDNRPAR
jgi:hypothetical protein